MTVVVQPHSGRAGRWVKRLVVWCLFVGAIVAGVLLWLRVTDTMRNAKPVPAAKRPPVTAVAWSGKVFLNERRFAQWLDSRGASYREWARLHPKAVATFEARHGRR